MKFTDAIGLLFITLKLCGVIDWAWWIVLAPLWAGLAFVSGLVAIAWIVKGLAKLTAAISKKRK